MVQRAKNASFLPRFATLKAFPLRLARLFGQLHETVRKGNCLANGKTLLKRCIVGLAWPQNGAKAAVSETCRALFGAYRGLQNSF
jgi:hypothetical protein